MEINPEMYAWLISLKIINPFVSSEKNLSTNSIPDKVINLLLGGKYMNIILKQLQDSFNNFKKDKINLMLKIKELIEIDENQDYIPNSIKYANWNLISEILESFGLKYTKDEIMKVINGDKVFLIKILTQIYELYTKFTNNSNNKNNNFMKINKKFQGNNNERYNLMNNKKIHNNNILNIIKINENERYEESKSLFEFFILSLSKNFNIEPRKAIALLSNNRKYLSLACKNGINNNYEFIENWLNDLDSNIEILLNLLKNADNGYNITYGIIGSAISSDNEDISFQSIKLIDKLYIKTGIINFEWFKQEGIDSFIYTINNHEKYKLEIMNILIKFISRDFNKFFNLLQIKAATHEKVQILKFLSNILPISKQLDSIFLKEFQQFFYNIFLNERDDISFSCLNLAYYFYYFYPIDDLIASEIIIYLKESIKSNFLNIFGTAVGVVFNLIDQLAKLKSKYAPKLYKMLVFLFLELYDDIFKREFFLDNFEKFLNEQQQIPIDIFLEPYLKQLLSVDNYNTSDLIFLFKIIEHPRIESNHLLLIINFLLNVCLNNIIYSRSSNLILLLMFEKKLIQNLCNQSDIKEINTKFIEFINNSLDIFMSTIKNLEDKILLETPYDIINEGIQDINNKVHDKIVLCIKEYRKIKKFNCNGLLAIFYGIIQTMMI